MPEKQQHLERQQKIQLDADWESGRINQMVHSNTIVKVDKKNKKEFEIG